MKNTRLWILLALVMALITAPHPTVTRMVVLDSDPFYWLFVRSLILVLATAPFVLRARRQLREKMTARYVLESAVWMSIAVVCYVLAINYSQASYVAIISLIIPIVMVGLSIVLLGERMTRRATAGIILAALGAMVLVVLPIALAQGELSFYPLATGLALVNAFGFSMSIIRMRQANEHSHMPLTAIVGVYSLMVMTVSGGLFWWMGDPVRVSVSFEFWLAAIYSALWVALLARILMVKVFERLGAAFCSAMIYFETFLAVLLPVFILGEQLSLTMVVGGTLILAGLYVIEHHKRRHARHHFVWRHH
ncbi:hypothetical protein CR983_00635 [Candidatus Saccharibacteria bacterium]|nr:MAG: hypothetical protein CR983_00635 [Candidatus Saccharibacteria bacterium]